MLTRSAGARKPNQTRSMIVLVMIVVFMLQRFFLQTAFVRGETDRVAEPALELLVIPDIDRRMPRDEADG